MSELRAEKIADGGDACALVLDHETGNDLDGSLVVCQAFLLFVEVKDGHLHEDCALLIGEDVAVVDAVGGEDPILVVGSAN